MYQDSHFSPTEEPSDVPQLPFPEPGGADTLQRPFSAPTHPQPANIPSPDSAESDTTQHPFPAHTQPTSRSDAPLFSFPASAPLGTTPGSPQFPFSTPTPVIPLSASPQQPISQQSISGYGYMQPRSAQPLPSTETIDTARIPLLQPSPASEAMHGASETVGAGAPFPQPFAGGPTSSFSFPGSQAAQGHQFTTQMPGLVEVPIITQALPAVAPATTPDEPAPSNQQAKRAIINGVISLIVSTFTLLTIAGFAGLIIGTFAIIYGFMGLRLAGHLPNKAGRGQALIGIMLGLLAWGIVIAASIFRAPLSS